MEIILKSKEKGPPISMAIGRIPPTLQPPPPSPPPPPPPPKQASKTDKEKAGNSYPPGYGGQRF